jgi:hypothetical protein
MGHLINARGFRVGWTLVWSDFWYAPLYDYSSFFFFCARLRAMLQLLFYAKIIDRSEFIFSHFEIIRYFKILYIIFIFILFILSFILQSCIVICDLLLNIGNDETLLNIKNPL